MVFKIGAKIGAKLVQTDCTNNYFALRINKLLAHLKCAQKLAQKLCGFYPS
tara:strand:+ start:523 stop:675 length:153 start_codon:yes stop_codon:yes gene_type:complete